MVNDTSTGYQVSQLKQLLINTRQVMLCIDIISKSLQAIKFESNLEFTFRKYIAYINIDRWLIFKDIDHEGLSSKYLEQFECSSDPYHKNQKVL